VIDKPQQSRNPDADSGPGNRNQEQRVTQHSVQLAPREREFRTLADSVPAMFSYVDAEQRYRYVNRRYEQHWDRPAAEIVGKTVAELLGPDGYERARGHVERALSGEQVTYQAEFAYVDGPHTMQVRYVPDLDEHGHTRGFFALIDDITPLKRAESAVRERETRLRAIMDTVPDAIITIDENGVIKSFNRAAEMMFGYDAKQAIGSNVSILMASPYREEHENYLTRYLESREAHIIDRPREVRGQRKDGSSFPMELRVTQVNHAGLFVGIARDLSAERQLEQEVAEASTYEQERIGQEIHDGLGQKLTALSMMAQSLKRELARQNVPESRLLNDIIEHLHDATGEARALSHGLAPVPLTEEGLAAALSQMADELEAATGTTVSFEMELSDPVEIKNRNTVMQLYRIAQEAVNNAIKHAEPRNIVINLGTVDGSPVLTVRDDGKGFRPEANGSEGFGLRIMQRRAAIINGDLKIESVPNAGTTVRCKVMSGDPE